MTNEEYAATQAQLTMLASIFRMLDVETFLARAADAQAIAPIVDPTLWAKGHRHLQAMEDLARAALAFKGAAGDFEARMLELGPELAKSRKDTEVTHGAAGRKAGARPSERQAR